MDMIERESMEPVYVLEVEQGSREMDLYYNAEGILIKAVEDSEDDSEDYLSVELPEGVKNFLQEKYAASEIVETDREHGQFEVDIIRPPRSIFAILEGVFDGFGQSRIRQVRFGHQPNGIESKPGLGFIILVLEIRNVIITPGFPFRTGFRIFLRKRRLQFFGNFQVVIIVITTLHSRSAYS